MKTKIQFLAMLLIATIAFMACDKDDDITSVPVEISQAFNNKYPHATNVEWERKGNYYVADFRMDGKDFDAWFEDDGNWVMTEMDITWNNLPETVQTSFNASEYASWRIEDVDLLEYPLTPMEYVIEVEQGEKEVQLFYSETGNLLRTRDVTNKDDTHRPS